MSVYPTPSTKGGSKRSKDKVEGPEAEAISRLEAAAEEALAKYPKASQWYQVVGALVDVARYDLDMLWVLTKSSVKFGAQDFLSKYKAKRAPFGHDEAEARLLVAERGRAANGSPSRSSDGEGHKCGDAQSYPASPVGPYLSGRGQLHDDAQASPASPAGLSAAEIAVESGLARASILRWMRVNGRPLGECTAREVRAWGETRTKQGIFARLLTHGVPPDDLVKKWIKDSDAEELWKRAQQLADNESQ